MGRVRCRTSPPFRWARARPFVAGRQTTFSHYAAAFGGGRPLGKARGVMEARTSGPPSMMRQGRLLSFLFVAVVAGLVVGAIGVPAWAVETPVGSKNFNAPSYAPNYFSNETGALGGAAGSRGAEPRAAPVYVAPRAYERPSYSYAAPSRRAGHYPGHYWRHAAAGRRYHSVTYRRGAARRHFVQDAARGRRQTARARPAAAHHRAVHPQARSGVRASHLARR